MQVPGGCTKMSARLLTAYKCGVHQDGREETSLLLLTISVTMETEHRRGSLRGRRALQSAPRSARGRWGAPRPHPGGREEICTDPPRRPPSPDTPASTLCTPLRRPHPTSRPGDTPRGEDIPIHTEQEQHYRTGRGLHQSPNRDPHNNRT